MTLAAKPCYSAQDIWGQMFCCSVCVFVSVFFLGVQLRSCLFFHVVHQIPRMILRQSDVQQMGSDQTLVICCIEGTILPSRMGTVISQSKNP